MVEGKIGEGAEAIIYETEVLGISAIAKERVRKEYRVQQLDSEIRRVRTKTEAKVLARAAEHGASVPSLLMVGNDTLYTEKINGTTLNTVMESLSKGKRLELESAMEDSGRQLALLHKNGIAHGDYTPANLMIDETRKLWVIDFGLGSITDSAEEKALDLLLMKRSVSRQLYSKFEYAYTYSDFKHAKVILAKLEEIERRGRYQTRTLITG